MYKSKCQNRLQSDRFCLSKSLRHLRESPKARTCEELIATGAWILARDPCETIGSHSPCSHSVQTFRSKASRILMTGQHTPKIRLFCRLVTVWLALQPGTFLFNPFFCCIPGWATGTMPTSVLSYSDFISRPGNKDSVITFEKVRSSDVRVQFTSFNLSYIHELSFEWSHPQTQKLEPLHTAL